jgi:hypothetical protein
MPGYWSVGSLKNYRTIEIGKMIILTQIAAKYRKIE